MSPTDETAQASDPWPGGTRPTEVGRVPKAQPSIRSLMSEMDEMPSSSAFSSVIAMA